MKKLLFICSIVCFFAACANSQQEKPASEPVKAQTQKAVQKTGPTTSQTATTNQRSNVIRSTSRPQTEIEQAFPYDIDLKKTDGSIVNSADVIKKNGKPTIVLFWLTTCYPCKLEMKAIHQKFPQWKEETDFNLVAISTDFSKNFEKFVNLVNDSGWKWDTYNDVNREFRYVMPGGLNGLPQTFVLDKDGEIVYHKRKYLSGDEDKLYEKVKQLASK